MQQQSTADRVYQRLRFLCGGTVKSYTSDWLIDQKTIQSLIEQIPPAEFIHVARTNGTYLLPIITGDLDKERPFLFGKCTGRDILRQHAAMFDEDNCSMHDARQIHHYDGSNVKPITKNNAKRLFLDAAKQSNSSQGVQYATTHPF